MSLATRRHAARALLVLTVVMIAGLGSAAGASAPSEVALPAYTDTAAPEVALPDFTDTVAPDSSDLIQDSDSDAAPDRAQEPERIVDFDADITVKQDGGMDVVETIEVQANDVQISHGLLREFPTTYRRRDGSRVVVGFDVESVTRDGQPEAYELERMKNGTRVRIGSAYDLLKQGRHRYAIRYSTTRQLGFFPDFDELYWNVTGNGWTFPIDHASARITLPAAVPIMRWSVYTGPQGARGKDARVTAQAKGSIAFETTAPLGAYEGLTVAAAWQKGVVQAPSPMMAVWYAARDNLDLGVAVIGFVLLAGYYVKLYLWTRRRTPPRIVPLYEPPEGMSAAAVQYLVNKRHTATTFSLAIMELISIRAMRIDKAKGYPTFRLMEQSAQTHDGLRRDEMLGGVLEKLFRKDKAFSAATDDNTALRFGDARQLVEGSLSERLDKLIDLRRAPLKRGFHLWLLFLLACVCACWITDPEAGRNASYIAPLLAIPVAALTWLCMAWRKGTISADVAVLGLVFIAPFLAPALVLSFGLFGVDTPVRVLPAVLPALMLPVVMFAYRFAAGYTERGDEVMDRIAGFKQYLTLAEGPRLDALAGNDEKLQTYERFLPYAIALGVGSKWAAAFAGLAATIAGGAAVEAMQRYYGGHDLLRDDPVSGMRGVGSDIGYRIPSSSASSSSSAPGSSGSWSGSSSDSSSSGSSDSGSSGGGGGGGGGSGW